MNNTNHIIFNRREYLTIGCGPIGDKVFEQIYNIYNRNVSLYDGYRAYTVITEQFNRVQFIENNKFNKRY